MPSKASSMAQAAGAAAWKTGWGNWARASRPSMVSWMTPWAACTGRSQARIAPASTMGTASRLTRGMAKALAKGETRDTSWKISSSAGSSARETAHWAWNQARHQEGGLSLPAPA